MWPRISHPDLNIEEKRWNVLWVACLFETKRKHLNYGFTFWFWWRKSKELINKDRLHISLIQTEGCNLNAICLKKRLLHRAAKSLCTLIFQCTNHHLYWSSCFSKVKYIIIRNTHSTETRLKKNVIIIYHFQVYCVFVIKHVQIFCACTLHILFTCSPLKFNLLNCLSIT